MAEMKELTAAALDIVDQMSSILLSADTELQRREDGKRDTEARRLLTSNALAGLTESLLTLRRAYTLLRALEIAAARSEAPLAALQAAARADTSDEEGQVQLLFELVKTRLRKVLLTIFPFAAREADERLN